MRSLTIILLLAVCFFGGVTYGSFEKNRLAEEKELEEEVIEMDEPIEETEIEAIDLTYLEENDHFIHKSASLLEKVVTSVFEFIIQMMYRIANVFFG